MRGSAGAGALKMNRPKLVTLDGYLKESASSTLWTDQIRVGKQVCLHSPH